RLSVTHFFFFMPRRPPISTLFPYTTLFRPPYRRLDHPSSVCTGVARAPRCGAAAGGCLARRAGACAAACGPRRVVLIRGDDGHEDRKSTRLNSSHVEISYAVFCLKKKIETI